jgi:predicted TIM-barrel fold metal-dependent hydrolase
LGARLPWSMDDLDRYAKDGYAGLKVHCHYVRGINSAENIAKFRRQGELNLPVLGFHIADPPEGKYLKPGRDECIADAVQAIESCPKTTFIMAHGFWLMNNDKDLDRLGGYFDRFPNLFVDLSAVDQWWDSPEPTPDKLRAFVLKYQDRLMWGTDGNPSYNTKNRYEKSFRVFESEEGHLKDGFFTSEAGGTIQGLHLPLETLNRIYWWNAARTIPRVRQALTDLGYVTETGGAK